ncbi:hypothetical protein KEM54_005138 [Ascosphaera aggregata]|nr:hypothetical protein KEM54_005138 [Ascosphaera aggregata]
MGRYTLRATPRMPFDEIPSFAMRNALALTSVTTLADIKPPFPWKWHERHGYTPLACRDPRGVENRLEMVQLFILIAARLQLPELRPWGDPIVQALISCYLEARTYNDRRYEVDVQLVAEILTWDVTLSVEVVVDAFLHTNEIIKYYRDMDERLEAAEATEAALRSYE